MQTDGVIGIDGIGSAPHVLQPGWRRWNRNRFFFAALESAATYTIDGNFIELRNADDAIAVHMVRELEVELPEPDPGVPTGCVTAPNGVNIRSGPGTNFRFWPSPLCTTGEIARAVPMPAGGCRHYRRRRW